MCKTKYQKLLTKDDELKCLDIVLKEKMSVPIYAAIIILEVILVSCIIALGITYLAHEESL